MSAEAMEVIESAMKTLGINYEFGVWASPVVYPYFVGEYQETPSINEDGMQETAFILNGFSRESWTQLEEIKEKIKNYFGRVGEKTVITDNGSAVAVFYSHSLIVPTGDAKLKRIEINLTIKEWSVK